MYVKASNSDCQSATVIVAETRYELGTIFLLG